MFEDDSILVEPTNAELAAKLGIQPKAKRDFYDLIVIGGGPAGLATALYSAREGLDALVVERGTAGGQAGMTERIDNYPGFPEGISGATLADQMRLHCDRFGAEKLMAQQVTGIKAEGNYRLITTDTGDEYGAFAILLAVGTTYRRLNVPGEEDFIGAGVHFCATCDGPFYQGEDMVVVGGGNSGVEEGLFLTKFANKVTLLERGDRLGASQVLREKAAGHPKMEVMTNTVVEELRGNSKLNTVVTRNTESGETREMHPGAVFVFIGLDPNSAFLRDTIDLDEWNFIKTYDNMQTSMAGVFAAGDARAGSTKQVASAVGEGVAAALMIRQYLEKIEGNRGYRGD